LVVSYGRCVGVGSEIGQLASRAGHNIYISVVGILVGGETHTVEWFVVFRSATARLIDGWGGVVQYDVVWVGEFIVGR